jgi:N-acetyl-anhydromuramyl-L-alanine amidase AmpD
VRQALRGLIANLEQTYPDIRQTMLAAMSNLETGRLLDPRYLDIAES